MKFTLQLTFIFLHVQECNAIFYIYLPKIYLFIIIKCDKIYRIHNSILIFLFVVINRPFQTETSNLPLIYHYRDIKKRER